MEKITNLFLGLVATILILIALSAFNDANAEITKPKLAKAIVDLKYFEINCNDYGSVTDKATDTIKLVINTYFDNDINNVIAIAPEPLQSCKLIFDLYSPDGFIK